MLTNHKLIMFYSIQSYKDASFCGRFLAVKYSAITFFTITFGIHENIFDIIT